MYGGMPQVWAKHDGQRPYYLTDPLTQRRNPYPELMDYSEALECNARLEKLGSRHRWVQGEMIGETP